MKNKMQMLKVAIKCLCILLFVLLPVTTSEGASSLKLKYDGKTITYSKTVPKFSVNGKEVSVGNAKGIIINNTAMGYYKAIFEKTLGATCVVDSTTKKLVISKFDNKVEMTLDSKTAYVNGKKKTMDVAPKKVTYVAAGITRILVPVRFVAENLGYSYTWVSSGATGAIKYNWLEYERDNISYKYTGSKVKSTYNGKNISYGTMPGMILSGSAIVNGKQVFGTGMGLEYSYSSSQNTITIKNEEVKVVYTLNSNKVFVNGKEQKVSVAPFQLKNCEDNKTYNMIPVRYTAETMGYDYQWNKGAVTSQIKEKDIETYEGDIIIPLPEAVSASAVKDTDQYWNKKFVVTITGDYVDFLKKNPVNIQNEAVKSFAVSLNSSNNTKITFTTTKLQGYQISVKDKYISIKVGNPKEIYPSIVVLDCGHGGSDSGALGGNAKEKDLNYTILYTYAKSYFNKADSKVKAYWTRHDDTFISLSDRAAYAKSIGADLFISLHMNSASSTAKGMEVYYSASNNSTLKNGLNSKTMASMMLNGLLPVMNTTNRGVKTANYAVIYRNTVPAILIELGFISNSEDRTKLTDSAYQKKAAKKIYDVTANIFAKYPTGR